MRESGEDCDDGNNLNGDGCSQNCTFEDVSGTNNGNQFICTTAAMQLSKCCAAVQNPVTLANVCDCTGQASNNPAYTIAVNCAMRDVDECATAAFCHRDAVCENLDGTQLQGTHKCRCPPGMLGDGVTRCVLTNAPFFQSPKWRKWRACARAHPGQFARV